MVNYYHANDTSGTAMLIRVVALCIEPFNGERERKKKKKNNTERNGTEMHLKIVYPVRHEILNIIY